ncbi:metallophosphoesterase family protein [Enterococcus sp. AZ196]|uniref:metallophosphoesterase family protein n=1 Tax=Enterococcus sp. AZ196 TaxID=2774659 RepID=UPI003D2C5CD1
MKFLHAADLHLDRSFEGLIAVPEHFQEQLAAANQKMLRNIVDTAIAEAVDFILLAGDTFHQNRPTLKTQRYFFQEMARLDEASIPVFMNFGNHDFYQADRYWFAFPDNIQRFNTEQVETKTFRTGAGEKVGITSFSYQHPTIEAAMVEKFPHKQAVDFQIGMYHGGQMPYAPFQLTQLVSKGYDYWALGHIHVPQVLSQQPYIIYPGTPQGHTQKETNLTGVTLVESQGNQLIPKSISVEAVRWEKRTLSLAAVRHPREIFSLVRKLTVNLPTLLHLELSDTENLGEELAYKLASGELLEALQEEVAQEICLWQLTLTEQPTERPYLAVDKELVDQLIMTYQAPPIFNELLSELDQNPQLHHLMDHEFRADAVALLEKKMRQSYQFRRAADVD